MKNNIKQNLRVIAGMLLLAVAFTACDNRNDLGFEMLPGEDLINVKNVVIKDDISAYTHTEDGLISSGGTSLLGSLNDPVFGSSHINFAAQFRLSSYPAFGTNPVPDSVRLFLYFRTVYGDTITPQHLKVYEMAESIDPYTDYTQDIDLKSMAYDNVLGEIDYLAKVKMDSTETDTLYQLISIPLDNSLGEKLVNLDSLSLISNDVFLKFFKGLYIEAEKLNGSVGNMIKLEAASSSSFQGSALVVYYNNDENIEKELDPEEDADTLSRAFIITPYSARVNSIEHDYTGTVFEGNLNQEVVMDEYLYIQPTGGLKSKFYIEGLENWKDSTNTAINKAELVFQVDTIVTDKDNFAPPSQLLVTFIDDDGEERIPADYFFNPLFYGGYLNSNYQYRFNITQHMQRVIEGDVGNNGFYLSTGRKTSYANRVVLESPLKGSGVQLIVTYSKLLE
ncbi:DUF4270 domain-containing protein [Prolixibacteraceae bacterium Z1-6]|uniref:DUF4270 domain-containing protein n=1 Tax=Draconibacterium aestuarii TaxID=2998507 RepID=A0A9X3F624_9BACT|nr:DUF4270 domain-containing protein [Prolixibacteraceae bacterium Z1-6]